MKVLGMAIGLIILVSFGCNRSSNNQSEETQVEWAYQLIDEGRYTEAIDIFWNLLHENDTPTIRIGLASAYAARAGIQVQSYWELVLPLVKSDTPNTNKSIQKLRDQWNALLQSMPDELRNKLSPKTDEIMKANEQIEDFRSRFEKIPLLNSIGAVGDVMMARSIIKDEASLGTHLYRALLTLVLIRFETNESSHQFQNALKAINSNNLCPEQFKNWILKLETPLDLVSDLILDVKIAYPSKLEQITPFENQYKNYHSVFSNLITLLSSKICPQL